MPKNQLNLMQVPWNKEIDRKIDLKPFNLYFGKDFHINPAHFKTK